MHYHTHTSAFTPQRTLIYVLLLTISFLIVEVIGSVWTGSLALLSDAAHIFTDAVGLIISFSALKLGQRSADKRRTYGYQRFEILAAAFNAGLLFLIALYILYTAYQRFSHPPIIETWGMLWIAVIGLIINLSSMWLLHRGKEHNLNIKGAYLEVWSDMLGSLGVLIGAVLIQWLHWLWIDTLVAVLIGVWVLPRAWSLLKESINILLEGVPNHLNPEQIIQALQEQTGVVTVHDLHVWAITNQRIILTAHIVIAADIKTEILRIQLQQVLATQFHIFHTTLQLETIVCADINKCPS